MEKKNGRAISRILCVGKAISQPEVIRLGILSPKSSSALSAPCRTARNTHDRRRFCLHQIGFVVLRVSTKQLTRKASVSACQMLDNHHLRSAFCYTFRSLSAPSLSLVSVPTMSRLSSRQPEHRTAQRLPALPPKKIQPPAAI